MFGRTLSLPVPVLLMALLVWNSFNVFIPVSMAFVASSPSIANHHHRSSSSRTKLNGGNGEQQVLLEMFWITSFSASHIGMSAARDTFISNFGSMASKANLINRDGFKLPSYWPGDDFGKNEIFPNEETAGRQIYRFFYTLVSFTTLGNALGTYLQVKDIPTTNMDTLSLSEDSTYTTLLFGIASLSFAISITSLFNASPMSLMPSFQQQEQSSGLLLKRKDSLKLIPRGLTRISRHPLILPVVPWGIATSILLGGKSCDFILFVGLSIYAIAGCYCQDLRIIRKEGSVGTVMQLSNDDDYSATLQNFYQQTSFVPFQAILDGRQSVSVTLKEFPFLAFTLLGIPLGIFLQTIVLEFLS